MRESYEDASSPTNTLQPGRGSYQDPGSRRNPMAVLYSSMNGSFNMDREASYASPSDYQVIFLVAKLLYIYAIPSITEVIFLMAFY